MLVKLPQNLGIIKKLNQICTNKFVPRYHSTIYNCEKKLQIDYF